VDVGKNKNNKKVC